MVLKSGNIFNRTDEQVDEFFNFNNIGSTRVAVKTVNETTTASSVLQDDNELVIQLQEPNNSFMFKATIFQTLSDISNDFKYKISVPAGTIGGWTMLWRSTNKSDNEDILMSGTIDTTLNTGDQSAVIQSGFDGELVPVELTGAVTTTGVAGDLQVQWAQNTGGAGDTMTVHAGSSLEVTRLE